MKLNISKIKVTGVDLKRKGLKLPGKLTPKLAEDIGIMVGDGCVYFRKSKYDYDISVTGHLITDRVFIKRHVMNLKKELFNIDFKFIERPIITTCLLRTYSKGLFEFYTKIIGLPIGPKVKSGIPKIIMDSNTDIKRAFLRGLADTDMTLVFKRVNRNVLWLPVIKLGTASKKLIIDTKIILENLGFKVSVSFDMKSYHTKMKKTYITNELYLYGKNNLNKWVKEIGFNNPKNILRYNLWKKKGFSLPNKEIERIMSGPGGNIKDISA